ncbi:MAG TPA: 3-hydroxybutyryl-CoA dehydrogenase [Gammaproteobacteria bacterium]|jgi:3-hydroxybutyryl-CoA dehydrogenase|nr:3-hydroxybutyryl-CoA dehydrogenase [Gammaproteobacteria bacterium]PHS08030.1 MAG: 3-hydroxybutyryl-CoA dehydrogenase [Acidithiobacillus sp.]RTZ66080.1 MAG: 3-hydroxybutyryl-CoA dehydrogenase [Gammaproteobacteria bacterium]HAD36830.1 3-hydroxybutyryl-CoA dehydrogenase [Gammaproteobacteria bacterium]HBK77277.1 3-hydroxybutyryl-CoA dehydrogenase [Gammaproteobacteria bacterium]|tara:strand:+ start:4502 stop:5356 length:855 start_codon:yes stop_codon:yes gene_type:complete
MKISNIGIVGAGTMGSGISQVAALTDHDIVMQDVSEEATRRGLGAINKSLQRLVDREKITADAKDTAIGKIKTTTDLSDLADCDLVIEAATENMALKLSLFEQIDKVSRPETIIASNTSSLSLTKLASVSGRPDKVIGMHFFNPVPMMALVEIIRALQTSDDTFTRVDELTRELGKTPVSVKDSPGFVVNRMLVPMINEAVFILYEGLASADEIDAAMKLGAGHPMGPLALADMIGIDVCLYVMNILLEEFGDSKFRPCPLLKQMVDAGYLGKKSGKGFFDYGQ